jgi:glycosyltransferase involved in cell wall biosynthesis
MRALALMPYPHDQVPSQRFRLEQWMPWLRKFEIECDVVPFLDRGLYDRIGREGGGLTKALGLLKAAAKRCWVAGQAADYDVILLHREAMVFGPAIVERLMARQTPVVLDMDDAIWLRNVNPVNPIAQWVKCPGKVKTIAGLASAVLAGNSYLASWAMQFNTATYVVPTTIDTDGAYATKRIHGPRDVPVIGWSGSVSTLPYLESLRPALEALARRRRYRLMIICNGAPRRWSTTIDVEWRVWSSAREVDDLLQFDIGLMPQPDEEWGKGKCGLKALQYMALGIPPVASKNGALLEIINDGLDGFLVGNAEVEWLERLEALLADWHQRATMGQRARITVADRYSATRHAPRVAAIIRHVAAQRRSLSTKTERGTI